MVIRNFIYEIVQFFYFMNDQQKREELVKLHENMRTHLYRIIDGLTQDTLLKKISDEEHYPHTLSLIWHIGGAETYWFHKAGHDIGSKFSIESFDEIRPKLEANTEGIKRVIGQCASEQLRIIPPTEENGPSIAWCLLRTYQHGLYHSAQISKIRHMIGAPSIAESPDTWSPAVDSITKLITTFWNSE